MKDPAFLFYPKDWIQGTADLMPDEKGVYIDLLAHQHQKGSLPSDINRLARLSGLSITEFEPIWSVLSCKFIPTETGLVNKKLNGLIDDRKDKGHKNKIIGKFASLIRYTVRNTEITTAKLEKIKKEFNVDAFLPFTTEIATERLTEWYKERLESIGNNNTISIIDKTKEYYKKNIEENKEKEKIEFYKAFANFLFSTNPSGKPISEILKIENQVDYDDFCKLFSRAGGDMKQIFDKLATMMNDTKYTKGKKFLFLTLNNWFNQDAKRKP